MKTRHQLPTVSIAFLLVAGIVGCEKNPNTEVKSAETELTSEQRKSQQEDAMLRQKQADELAAKQQSERVDQAELRRKQESERAETNAESRMATSDAEQKVTHANEQMAQDRRELSTKSTERVQKLDAKTKELKTKSAKLTAVKKQDFNNNLTKYTAERDAVNAKINNLSGVTDDAWQNAKRDLEKRLDALENIVDKMDRDL
jgi:hypothetical protein